MLWICYYEFHAVRVLVQSDVDYFPNCRGGLNSVFGQIPLHFIGFNFSKSLTQNRPTSFQDVDKFHRLPPTIKPITTIRHGGVDEKSIFQCFFSRFCFVYGRLTRLIFLLRFLAFFVFPYFVLRMPIFLFIPYSQWFVANAVKLHETHLMMKTRKIVLFQLISRSVWKLMEGNQVLHRYISFRQDSTCSQSD